MSQAIAFIQATRREETPGISLGAPPEWTNVGTCALKITMDWLFTDETAATLIVIVGVGLLAVARRLHGP